MENTYEDEEVYIDALDEIKQTEHTLISLYALDGFLSLKTIQLIGEVTGRDMTIQIVKSLISNY